MVLAARVGKIYHMGGARGISSRGPTGKDIAASRGRNDSIHRATEAHTPGDYACLNMNNLHEWISPTVLSDGDAASHVRLRGAT